MKISNKLTTKDFVDLQKNLLNYYNLSPGLTFFTKYIVNFLYGLFTFILLYFILVKFGIKNLIIPTILGLLVFLLLVYFHEKIYKSKMNKIIQRTYGRENYNIDRVLTLEEQGVTVVDNENEAKTYSYDEMVDFVKENSKRYVILPNSSGLVFNVGDLSKEEIDKVDSYFNNVHYKK